MIQGSEGLSLYEVILNAVQDAVKNTHVCLPAKIDTYDSGTQSADVLLMINEIDPDSGEQDNTEQFLLTGVPVQFYASKSDSFVSLPLGTDTFGCVVFADKSLDDYLQSDGNQPVDENLDPRNHDLSDAVFVPGMRPYSQYINGYSSDNMVIKNSSMKIELDPDGKISITGGSRELLTIIESSLGHVLDFYGHLNTHLTALNVAFTSLGIAGLGTFLAPAAISNTDRGTYNAAMGAMNTAIGVMQASLSADISNLTVDKADITNLKIP